MRVEVVAFILGFAACDYAKRLYIAYKARNTLKSSKIKSEKPLTALRLKKANS